MRTMAKVRFLGAAALVCAIALSGAAVGAEDSGKPDATIELEDASAAVGVGYTWGRGVLVYKGKRHPFKMDGLTAGELGGTKVNARGDVYHLKNLSDFNGLYTSSGAGATARMSAECRGGASAAVPAAISGATQSDASASAPTTATASAPCVMPRRNA